MASRAPAPRRPVVVDHRDLVVARALVSLQRRAYAVEAALIGFDRIPPLHESAEDLAAADDLVVLADLPLGLVGFRRQGDAIDIDRLAVDPACFRQGVASALLDAVHAHDAAVFTVSTGRANAPALALYARHGYERVRDEALPDGPVITHLARRRPPSTER